MRRVRASIRIDIEVAGTPTDDEARRVALRYIKTWMDAGLPAPETGVSVELKHVRAGRVARK